VYRRGGVKQDIIKKGKRDVSAKNLKQTNDFQTEINEPGTQLNGPNSNKREGPFNTQKDEDKKFQSNLNSLSVMAKSNPRATRWAFTTPQDCEEKNWAYLQQAQFNEEVVAMIVGKEIGTKTGYPHFQGYVEMHTKKSLWQMKKLLGTETHLEIAAGTKADNVKYCMKEKNVVININTESKKKQTEDTRTEKYINLMRDARSLSWTTLENKHPIECFHHREKLQKIRLEQISKNMKEWVEISTRKTYGYMANQALASRAGQGEIY
jgi:hypothetical protein